MSFFSGLMPGHFFDVTIRFERLSIDTKFVLISSISRNRVQIFTLFAKMLAQQEPL